LYDSLVLYEERQRLQEYLGGEMTKFEEMGRKLDQELERLHDVAEKKISPTTRLKAGKALRKISGGLERLAEELEAKPVSKE
jgi:hypothetical protein